MLLRPEGSSSVVTVEKDTEVLVTVENDDGGEPNTILLSFEDGDSDDPRNWSRWYRWYLSLFNCFLVFATTFASSAPSGYAADLLHHFHMTSELVALTITLFVIGFCFGPLLWGPLSEQFGRRAILIPCYAVFTACQVGAALSPNSASIMLFRLLGGIFSAAAHPTAPALIADVWDPATREKALTYLGFFSFIGPTLGPLVGGFMAAAHISWQWIFWLLTILSGTCTLLVILTQKETYRPLLLARKAERMRRETGDPRYRAPFELLQKPTLLARLYATLAKPFVLFVREPALIAVTVYLSFIGGCLYMLFEAYPVVFEEGHHFPSNFLGLAYLPVTVGTIVTMICYLSVFQPRYERLVLQYAPEPIPPEERLVMAVWAAPLFAITFFWFGWTSFPQVNFWVPLLSGLLMGMSTLALVVSLLNYIIDVYSYATATALGACTVLRSIFGAIFPLFSRQMFRALSPRWASTLVGCLAVLMIPIPVVLTRYGPALRAKSHYIASV
ncbi:MFS general substrate transporter [Lentinus brumalis]|uniref:MFS general substrate transporter n=1 Tax=Lentinus brumalis TaxID=2498619 RepID=A0A371DQ71_9APHY|nr:MFS general substrate transporter [Polyporus brumalis]